MELRNPQHPKGCHCSSSSLKLPCIYQILDFLFLLLLLVQLLLPTGFVQDILISNRRTLSFRMHCPAPFVGAFSTITRYREVSLKTPHPLLVEPDLVTTTIYKAETPIFRAPMILQWTCILILPTMNFRTRSSNHIFLCSESIEDYLQRFHSSIQWLLIG